MSMYSDPAFRLKVSAKEDSLLKLLGPFENRIMALQSVLVWEDPRYSSALFVAVHILFWLACTVQVFYLVGIVGSVSVFLNMWTNHIWPEIKVPPPPDEDLEGWTPVHPRLLSLHELVSYLSRCLVTIEELVRSAVDLRRHHRTIVVMCLLQFFIKAMLLLTSTALLGYYIPGVYMAYLMVISMLLLPCALYHSWSSHLSALICPYISEIEEKMHIKRRKKGRSKDVVTDKVLESSDDELVAFAPQGSTPSLLTTAGDSDDDGTGFTPRMLTPVGESPSHSLAQFDGEMSDLSLTPFMDEMPSHSSSMSSFLPDVSLMPTIDHQWKEEESLKEDELNTTLADDSSVESSSEKPDTVQFVPSHFDDDSSVGEEEHLVEGMDFSAIDSDSPDGQQVYNPDSVGLLAAGQTMLAAAMTNPVVMATVSKATPLLSDAVSSVLSTTRSGLQTLRGGVTGQTPETQAPTSSEYSEENVAKAMAEALKESRDVTPTEEQELMEEFEFLNKEDVGDGSDEELP